MVHALRRDDLGLVKYIDMICMVGINDFGNKGFVLFRSTHTECFNDTDPGGYHPCLGNFLRFTAKHSQGLEIEHETPTFHTLAAGIQQQILRYSLTEAGSVEIDVDSDSTATISTPTTLMVSQQLYSTHALSLRHTYWSSHFEFILHLETVSISFSEFQALKKCMHLGATSALPFRGHYTDNLSKAASIKLSLNFDIPNHTASLGVVQFSAIPLIVAMAHVAATNVAARNNHGIENRVMVQVTATTRGNEDGTLNQETHEFSLKELRHTVLVQLTRMITRNSSIKNKQCSDVVINGYGRVVDLVNDLYSGRGPDGSFHKSSGYEGLDWNPEWTQQTGDFDGTTVCFMNYLWRIFKGGNADACARICE